MEKDKKEKQHSFGKKLNDYFKTSIAFTPNVPFSL